MKTKILVLSLSLLMALAISEVIVRVVDQKTAKDAVFSYFWSNPNFEVDDLNAVRMASNSSIREVCIADGKLEFDVVYQTNNLGLIDEIDYPQAEFEKSIALLGDSYTAGVGAARWVPGLRSELQKHDPEYMVYNLGITGTGILHFERLLSSVARAIEIDWIIILVITADFDRQFWQPLVSNEGVRLCPEKLSQDCQSQPLKIYRARLDEPVQSIVDRWSQVVNFSQKPSAKQADSQKDSNLKRLIRKVVASSALLSRLNGFRHRVLGSFRPVKLNYYKENLEALYAIKKAFPNKRISLLQFPSKNEVLKGRFLFNLGEDVKSLEIEYVNLWKACEFSKSMYHSYDHHFNAAGYKQFSQCVSEAILSH